MELFLLLVQILGNLLILILLYDFFAQPFRFYGMDPLTRFVWGAARKICSPFESFARSIIRIPERDLAPLFTVLVVIVCRGLLYGGAIVYSSSTPISFFLGMTMSFLDLFLRLLIPGILFLLYMDIQLSRHQDTFTGNVMVMLIHDVVKRFIVMIRKLLPSYRPLYVFLSVFIILGVLYWILLLATLLPFESTGTLDLAPGVLMPEVIGSGSPALLRQPLILFVSVMVHLTHMFLFGIFILLLLNMITGFSGLDPYDRTSILLGLVVAPWLAVSRRYFGWARAGVVDFSVAILLILIWIVLGVVDELLP